MSNLSGSFSGNYERAKKLITLPSGRKVTILETTGKEEKILSKLADKKSTGAIEQYMVGVCEALDGAKEKPTTKQFLDMLTGDRMMILLQARLLTHGSIVNYKLTCTECGKKSEHEIDIEKIAETSLPYPHGDKRECSVKFKEGEIWFELPNGKTEEKIASSDGRDVNSKVAALHMWEVLADGTKMPVSIDNLKSRHLSELRKSLKENEYVMDTTAVIICPSCRAETTINAIVNPDFLFPNAM